MGLTTGDGPLGRPPASANYEIDGPKHKLFFNDFPRRVRARLGGEEILDTTRGKLLHETGILPRLYVPRGDLRDELLEATDHTTHCPFKGDASYWSVRAGVRVAENAVWAYVTPLEAAAWLDDYASVYFDEMDEWFDEDEPIRGHLRDPYHRVDARRTSYPIRVSIDGTVVAESSASVVVSETGLPNRWYIPAADVKTKLLTTSEKKTHCPYKGDAAYFSAAIGDARFDDVAWAYDDPFEDAAKVAGYLSFDGDEVATEIEGRPV